MLDQLEWDTLESRRSKIQLNTFYKIVRNLIDVNASDYLIPQTRNTRSSHDYNYQVVPTSIMQNWYTKIQLFPTHYPCMEWHTRKNSWEPLLINLQKGAQHTKPTINLIFFFLLFIYLFIYLSPTSSFFFQLSLYFLSVHLYLCELQGGIMVKLDRAP